MDICSLPNVTIIIEYKEIEIIKLFNYTTFMQILHIKYQSEDYSVRGYSNTSYKLNFGITKLITYTTFANHCKESDTEDLF